MLSLPSSSSSSSSTSSSSSSSPSTPVATLHFPSSSLVSTPPDFSLSAPSSLSPSSSSTSLSSSSSPSFRRPPPPLPLPPSTSSSSSSSSSSIKILPAPSFSPSLSLSSLIKDFSTLKAFIYRSLFAHSTYLRLFFLPLFAFLLGLLRLSIFWPLSFIVCFCLFSHFSSLLFPPPSNEKGGTSGTSLDSMQAGMKEEFGTNALLSSPLSPSSSPLSETHRSSLEEELTANPAHDSLLSLLPAFLTKHIVEFPQWLRYPDLERTKWLNDLIDLVWPYASVAVRDEVNKQVQSLLQNPLLKGRVTLRKLDFGSSTPFSGGIKVYDTKDENVMLDIDLRCPLEPCIIIDLHIGPFILPITVDLVSAVLNLRCVLSEICGKFPCFRRVGLSCASRPHIMMRASMLTVNVFDVPILGSLMQHAIEDVTMRLLGWPRELSIPIMVESEADIAEREKREPKGMLHVFLISASNLKKGDLSPFGKSDPYCKLHVGNQQQISAVVSNNLNPVWDADFEFIVFEPEKEVLRVEVLDSDTMMVPNPLMSKSLGDIAFPLQPLLSDSFQDVSMPLDHAAKGSLRFQCEWRAFKPLHASLHRRKECGDQHSSTSVLFVSNLRVSELPVDNCRLVLQVGSAAGKRTASLPVRGGECDFDDRFSFNIVNVEIETLSIQIRYDDNMGKLTGFATRTASLGMLKEVKTKSVLLGECCIDVREVSRTGHLSDDFFIPLEASIKAQGRPRLHASFLLRELAASVGNKQRQAIASRAALPGVLTLTLLSARDLIGVDHGGKSSDPYVLIRVGTQHKKSSIKKKTVQPEWNERFEFQCSDLLRDDVEFECKDYAALSSVPLMGGVISGLANTVTFKKERLGDTRVPLRLLYAGLYQGEEVVKEIALHHVKQGVLKLSFQFTPAEGVVMPHPTKAMAIGTTMDSMRMDSLSRIDSKLGLEDSDGVMHALPSKSDQQIADPLAAEAANVKLDTSARLAANITAQIISDIERSSIGPSATLISNVSMEGNDAYSSSQQQSNDSSLHESALDSLSATPVEGSLPSSANVSGQNTPLHARSQSNSQTVETASGDIEIDSVHLDQKALEGFLCLTLHFCQGLSPQFKDGTSAAYVKVAFGKTRMHTAVVRAVDPTWNAKLRIPVHTSDLAPSQTAVLRLRVKQWVKRMFGSNATVGEADLMLTQTGVPTPLSNAVTSSSQTPIYSLHDLQLEHHMLNLLDSRKHLHGSISISANFESSKASSQEVS